MLVLSIIGLTTNKVVIRLLPYSLVLIRFAHNKEIIHISWNVIYGFGE